MSDYAAPATYWNPYSRTHEPVLTQEQVDGMWPNNRKANKEKLRASPMDDAMPNLPPAQEKAVDFLWPLDAGVPTDNEGVQLELFMPKAADAMAMNVMTAPSRLAGDMVNLPPHYARFKIEPIRFIGENKLDWFQGNIVKYVCRWDAKNGLEDLDKVIRYANMYRRYASGDPDWWTSGKPEDFKIE